MIALIHSISLGHRLLPVLIAFGLVAVAVVLTRLFRR